jgi:hypothetical protein
VLVDSSIDTCQTPHTARSVFVFTVLAELRVREIAVAVLNGVNGRTGRVGRDVDVLVRRRDLVAVARVCRAVAAGQGWNYEIGRWLGSWYPRGLCQQVFHRVESGRILNVAFDLICSDGIAAGLITAYSPNLLQGGTEIIEGVPTSVAGSHMKSGFVKVLAGIEEGFVRLEQLPELPPEVRQHITSILGEGFLRTYERCIREGHIRSKWRTLRRQAQGAYALRHPLTALRNGVISLMRCIFGSRVHHVQSIAIVGPDGVGKSSAIEYARRALAEAFLDVRYRHWRPQVLPNLARVVRLARSTARINVAVPPRRHAGRCASIRLLYYGLDYLAGYWLRDRWSTSSEVPVNLYDRCALDMVVDPLRFGLPQRNRSLWLYRSVSKVNRVILLHDRPENITARKAELSNEEIRRQFNCWKALYCEGLVDQIINVDEKSVEAVGSEIAIAILDTVSLHATPAPPRR